MESTIVWRTDGDPSWKLCRTLIFPVSQKTEAQSSLLDTFTCSQAYRLCSFQTALKFSLDSEQGSRIGFLKKSSPQIRACRVICLNEFRTRKIESSCKTFVSRRLTKAFCYWNDTMFVSRTSMVFQESSSETLPGLNESNFLLFALSKIKRKETVFAIKTEAEAQEPRSSFLTQTWSSDSRLS